MPRRAQTRVTPIATAPPPAPDPACAIVCMPLNKLILSPRNVRRTDAEDGVEGLADDIAARGLIHNLVVTEGQGGRVWEVAAGGRRWRALHLLVKRGLLPRDWPVPCRVEPRESARETSLAENIHVLAMNPADEVEAYAHVVRDLADSWAGADAATPADAQAARIVHCARRFGVSERHVLQRLRLAALHPEILAALRERAIHLDAARGYAGHPDPEEQRRIFVALDKRGAAGDLGAIRDAVANRTCSADSPVVRYVGLDAYLAVGGRLETDLFFGADCGPLRLLDPATLDQLAGEKAQAEAAVLAAEGGWAGALVKSWTAPSWVEPRAAGFEHRWRGAERLAPAERAEALVSYEIDGDGDDAFLRQRPHAWVRTASAPVADAAASVADAAYDACVAVNAARRQEEILLRAARLAMPRFVGTPLEGRVFECPASGWVEPITQRPDGTFLVAVLVAVPAADIDAGMAEAEALLARDEAELAEEERALAAEAATDSEPAAIEAAPQPDQVLA